MSRILPTPLVFISGYVNTENVFYCLSRTEARSLKFPPYLQWITGLSCSIELSSVSGLADASIIRESPATNCNPSSASLKIVKHYPTRKSPFDWKINILIHVYMNWISKIREKQDTRIVKKKYHIPVSKGLQISYTQNPWPGLKRLAANSVKLWNETNLVLVDGNLMP